MSGNPLETKTRWSPLAAYARGFLVIGVFSAAGVAVKRVSGISIPAPLIGMLLLAGAFKAGMPVVWVEQAGGFLLKHMSLFFLPILLGAGRELSRNAEARVPVLVAVAVGTVLTLVVTRRVCEWRTAKPARKEAL